MAKIKVKNGKSVKVRKTDPVKVRKKKKKRK